MEWIASIVVGVLAMIGTIVGSIIASNKTQALIGYRLGELEKKVEKHNSIVERTFKIEKDLSTAFIRIDDIREEMKEIRKEN